jgi:hypothetical protein
MNTMKLLLVIFVCYFSVFLSAQSICNQNGNLIIYSNYDGGIVTINVDQNIPNLKIGICTYEPVQVTLTGQYLGNVTQVIYGGFNSTQGNNNCNLGDFPTSISGVNASLISINTAPPVGLENPNGNNLLVGTAGNCSSTQNAGGGNTPDQVVYYFLQATGGTFYAHFTQYSCWLNQTYNVSAGGNCCVTPSVNCQTPIANAGNSATICSGSAVNLGIQPSSNPSYQYSWFPTEGLNNPNIANPIASPTTNTTYTLTVINGDVSCSASASVDVTVETPQPVSISVNGSLDLCGNETVELIASPNFSSYQWSNNSSSNAIVVSTSGTYSVSAQTSFGCIAISDSVEVTANNNPSAIFTFNQIDNYNVQFISTDLSATSWVWDFGSGNTSTEANPIYNFPFDNIWPVSLIVNNECGADTLNELVNVIKNSIADMANFSFNLLYQNDKLLLTGNSSIPQSYSIELLSMSGQLIEKRSLQLNKDWQVEIPVQEFTPGLYFLSITSESGKKTKRLLID